MEETSTLDKIALDALRIKITKFLPAQIRTCVGELSEDQIWWRPNERANSVGNLVLHLSGSMRHNLSRGIGGMGYDRNRPAEFAERGPMPKQQLLSIFDETIRQASLVLDSFDSSRLLEATGEPGYGPTIFNQVLGVATHLATHTGQIVYITKMLKEGALDELWIQTYRVR